MSVPALAEKLSPLGSNRVHRFLLYHIDVARCLKAQRILDREQETDETPSLGSPVGTSLSESHEISQRRITCDSQMNVWPGNVCSEGLKENKQKADAGSRGDAPGRALGSV